MTDDGFYSSGHPSLDSSLQNPFGIVRSRDGGETLEILALHGEVDFHLMAAGYRSHVLYVYNPAPNSEMETAGFYYSLDNAASWTRIESPWLSAEITALAVHPEDEGTFAVGTRKELIVVQNFGQSYESVLQLPVTSLSFTPDGSALLAGIYDGEARVIRTDLESGDIRDVVVPPMKEDAVSYMSVHPHNPDEMVLTTFERNVYHTRSGGDNWTQIADRGTPLP